LRGYVIRRILYALIVVWGTFTVTFFLLYALPSNPVAIKLQEASQGGGNGSIALSPAQIQTVMAQYGFNKPLVVQYVIDLGRMLTGDLGTSIDTGVPVRTSLAQALPQTLELAAAAFVLGLLLGGSLGVLSNLVPFRWLRQVLQSLPPFAAAVPTFWSGLLLLEIFSFRLGWLPPFGNLGFSSLVLPAITLAIPTAAVVAQVLSKSLRDALASPYIETARAKGASRLRVHFRHAFRNGLIPSLTVVGITAGNLMAGSVIVETVFSRTGIGQLTEQAVNGEDQPVVLAVVVISAAVFAVANLIVDLLYPVIDPRIRRAYAVG
jgi:peptide/nickel transport system permease protein